jgi:Ni/Co efflux regulator RcnB
MKTILTALVLTLSLAAYADHHEEKDKMGHDKEHQHVTDGKDHEHDEAHHKKHDHKAHHPEHHKVDQTGQEINKEHKKK